MSAATPPSEWKQIAPLSPALLSMSLFPTKKQVLGLATNIFFFFLNFLSLIFTCVDGRAGKKLAESIVTEKLAACVNRVPGENFALEISYNHLQHTPPSSYLWFKSSNIWKGFGTFRY